jgi:hypothetical protein
MYTYTRYVYREVHRAPSEAALRIISQLLYIFEEKHFSPQELYGINTFSTACGISWKYPVCFPYNLLDFAL